MNLKDFSEPVVLFRERLRNAERMAAHGTDRQLYFHLRGLLVDFDILVANDLTPRDLPIQAPLPEPVVAKPVPDPEDAAPSRGDARKFTDDQVREMRRAHKDGASINALAGKWSCAHATMQKIVLRKTYYDVRDEVTA